MKKFLPLVLMLTLCLPVLAADTPAAPAAPVAPAAVEAPAAPAAPAVSAVPATPAKPALIAPIAAPATDVAPPDISNITNQKPETFWDKILAAVQAKEWGVVVGFIIMLIVFFVVKYVWTSFPIAWLPYMAIIFGVLGNVGFALAVNKETWWKAILYGLTTGAAASGLWSAVGKYVFGSMSKNPVANNTIPAELKK